MVPVPVPGKPNPCITCGACCTAFRVSFYWAEAGDEPDQVPVEMTEPLTAHRLAMKGTKGGSCLRCVGLVGTPGVDAYCGIHPRRPSPCRGFEASWEAVDARETNPRCDESRARYGLPPLTPADWGHEPEAPSPERPNPQRPRPQRRRRAA